MSFGAGVVCGFCIHGFIRSVFDMKYGGYGILDVFKARISVRRMEEHLALNERYFGERNIPGSYHSVCRCEDCKRTRGSL